MDEYDQEEIAALEAKVKELKQANDTKEKKERLKKQLRKEKERAFNNSPIGKLLKGFQP